MTEVELLSNRLRTLETHFRRVKVLGVIVCIIVATLGVMGQGPSLPGDVLPNGCVALDLKLRRLQRALLRRSSLTALHSGRRKRQGTCLACCRQSRFGFPGDVRCSRKEPRKPLTHSARAEFDLL